MSATQKQTILQLLNQAERVCGTEFQQRYIPEYRTRINELRKEGFTIDARRCTRHSHRGMMQEWSLVQKGRGQSQADNSTVSEKTTRINHSMNPLPLPIKTGNAYFLPTEREYCCEVYRLSIKKHFKPWHSKGCAGQT